MSGNIYKTLNRLGIFIMILLMTALLVNKAVYIHVHILPNGSVVTHAHPFNKTADSQKGPSHHHSNLEFFMFQNLEILILSSAMVLSLMILSKGLEKRWFIQYYHIPAPIALSPGRAPPPFI